MDKPVQKHASKPGERQKRKAGGPGRSSELLGANIKPEMVLSQERLVEIERTEAVIARQEVGIYAEIRRVMIMSRNLQRLFSELEKRSARLAAESEGDPEFVSLSKVLRWVRVADLDTHDAEAEAHDARLNAIEERKRALKILSKAAATYSFEITQLQQKLSDGELLWQRIDARIQERHRALGKAVRSMEAVSLEQDEPLPPPVHRRKIGGEMEDTSPVGKRQYTRQAMKAAVDFSSENNFYVGFSLDISEGGLFIATVEHPPYGEEVSLSFSLPDGQRIKALGVVCWVREQDPRRPEVTPGCGIRFIDLDPEGEIAVRRFLKQREAMFFDT